MALPSYFWSEVLGVFFALFLFGMLCIFVFSTFEKPINQAGNRAVDASPDFIPKGLTRLGVFGTIGYILSRLLMAGISIIWLFAPQLVKWYDPSLATESRNLTSNEGLFLLGVIVGTVVLCSLPHKVFNWVMIIGISWFVIARWVIL